MFRSTALGIVTAAALLLAATEGRAEVVPGRPGALHYVAVGVSRAPKLPPNRQLRFAQKDAQDCAQVLQGQLRGLYTAVAGRTLVDEQATRDNIRAALRHLGAEAQAGDTAIVFLAGHGDVGGRGPDQFYYFVPHDFDPARREQTALTEADLHQALAALHQRGVAVVLILDTCRAGAMEVPAGGVLVLAACRGSEFSHEDPELRNGLYTHALLEGLLGNADCNGDGIVTLAEVQGYLAQRLPQLRTSAAHPQTPTCHCPATVSGSLPLALCRPTAPPAGRLR